MKRILIVMMVCLTIIPCVLLAGNQSLAFGVLGEAGDLLDIRTPGLLEYTVDPYLHYAFGSTSEDSFTASARIDLPYVIQDSFDTLWPSLSADLAYQGGGIFTGLSIVTDRESARGTWLDGIARFVWYAHDRSSFVSVHPHREDVIDGLRFGIGLDAGAQVDQLLEDPAITIGIVGALVGRAEAGAWLTDRFRMQLETDLSLPAFSASSSFATYDLSLEGDVAFSVGYYGKSLLLSVGMEGRMTVADLFTENGFFDGTSNSYGFTWLGELTWFVMELLSLSGSIEFSGIRGSSDDMAVAKVGVSYFLL